MTDLDFPGQVYAAYLAGQVLLIVGFTAWFIVRLERIRASNGDLDLYLNYAFRLLPMQIALYLLWYAVNMIIWSAMAG